MKATNWAAVFDKLLDNVLAGVHLHWSDYM